MSFLFSFFPVHLLLGAEASGKGERAPDLNSCQAKDSLSGTVIRQCDGGGKRTRDGGSCFPYPLTAQALSEGLAFL